MLTSLCPQAQVRSGGGQQSPFLDELLAAQGTAETQGFGLFTKVSSTGWREEIHFESCISAISVVTRIDVSLRFLHRIQRQ